MACSLNLPLCVWLVSSSIMLLLYAQPHHCRDGRKAQLKQKRRLIPCKDHVEVDIGQKMDFE